MVYFRKNKLSFYALLLITVFLFGYRFYYSPHGNGRPMKVLTWDAFGYYQYLPATFIYHDIKKEAFLDDMNSKYQVIGNGGYLYQLHVFEDGSVTARYLNGVAILEMPFFFLAHSYALVSEYPADGFSPPYQWAIALGALFYVVMGLFILQWVLRRYFSDRITAIVLLLIVLATNAIQYFSIDGAMSHSWLFFLYSLLLFVTIKWHTEPKQLWASLIGLSVGLLTIGRPTEIISIMIPLFWNTHNKAAAYTKWQLVRQYKSHIYIALGFGVLAILPQLIYWQITTGAPIYAIGSKWNFLNPWFRVLFGLEEGWFIYTPITILMMVGYFFMKDMPFRKVLLWFGLINIWIIISWNDWRYGTTYSMRALVQSYPVYALTLGLAIQWIFQKRKKAIFLIIASLLLIINLIQIYYFNKGILDYTKVVKFLL